MPTTNVVPATSRNRNQTDFSFGPAEDRRRDTLLRLAWVNIVAGFKCRPSPRSPWDETASGDQTPWKYVVTPIRAALAAAIVNGDRQVVEQTLEGARAFCRELEADFASMVPAREEESLVAVALEETHAEGEANQVEAELIANPTAINADRAVQPLQRQLDRIGKLVRLCREAARQTSTTVATR